MKLYIEDGNTKVEVKEIDDVGNGQVLFFMLNARYKPEDLKRMEDELTIKTNKKCIMLDARFNKVLAI